MRYIKILILLLLSSSVFSQTTQFLGAPNTKVQNRGDFQVDSILYVPITLVSSRVPSQVGALRYRASDSSLYQWTGTAWRKTGITPSDTASMLSPYLRKADTTAMLLPYLRKSDTTSMLSPYVRNAGYGLTKVSQTLSADSLLLSTRAWRQKGVDSVASLPRVTSVSAGTGMSFTTITTTGSVSADTVALATRAWRQKGIDSLAASEVSINDTATMLNPYVRGTGTLNYVPKFTATGRRIGNSQIFDDGTNIGINTTTPSSYSNYRTMHLVGGTSGAVLDLSASGGVTSGGSLFVANPAFTIFDAFGPLSGTPAYFAFRTGTYGSVTERMRLTAAGRLLIGTTTEGTNTVDIAGTLRSTQGANFATSSGNVVIGSTSTGTDKFTMDEAANYRGISIRTSTSAARPTLSFINTSDTKGVFIQQDRSALAFGTMGSDYGGHSERMRIDSAGQLGIGTTAPDLARLDVNGKARIRTIDSTSSPINVLTSDVNGVIQKTSLGAVGVQGSGTTNRVAKFTASGTVGNGGIADTSSAVVMALTATNRVLINTSTDAGYQFEVNGTARTGTLSIRSTTQTADVSTFFPTGAVGNNIFFGVPGTTQNGTSGQSSYNTGVGRSALAAMTTGFENTAIGFNAKAATTTGARNVAVGVESLRHLTTGSSNTAIGHESGKSTNAGGNNTTSTNSTYIGKDTRASANGNTNEIVIGDAGRGNGSNTTTIGNSSTTDTYLLGRLDIGTIDSSASPINMLWADNNGVIRKTSAPINYGTFSDTTTQGITSANTEQAINFGVTEDTLGVFVSNSSRINVRKAGTYLVTFSAQVTKTDAGTDDIFFWVKKNGNAVARTASKIQLDGNGAEQLATVTYIFTLAANDYIELFMQSPDEDCELLYATASGNIPVIPSIILTINQVK